MSAAHAVHTPDPESSIDKNNSVDELDAEVVKEYRGVDVTVGLIAGHGDDAELDYQISLSLRRKLDRHILPLLCTLYILLFLDKTTINQGSILGLLEDAHLSQNEFNNLNTAFYVGFIIFVGPHAFLMQKFPIAKYISFNIFLWPVFVGLQCTAKSYGPMFALRFLLGAAESCIMTGIMTIMTMFYTRVEATQRIGWALMCSGFASIIAGFLAFGVAHTNPDGRPRQWQWFMIILSVFSLIFALIFFIFFPDNPAKARFLSLDEKTDVVKRLRVNQNGIEAKVWKRYQFIGALIDPKTWFFFFFAAVSHLQDGLGIEYSLIIKGYGFDTLQTTLLGIPLGAAQVTAVTFGTLLLRKFPSSRLTMAWLGFVPASIAAILLIALPWSAKGALLFCVYLIQTNGLGFIMIISECAISNAGHTKKMTANAIFLIGYAAGEMLSTQFWKVQYRPRNIVPWAIQQMTYVANIFLILGLRWYLIRENRRRDAELEGVGNPSRRTATSSISSYSWCPQVITVIEAIQTNTEDCTALQQCISDLVVVAAHPWEGKTDDDVPAETMTLIESLRESLELVQADLEVYTKAGWFKKLVMRVDLGAKIKACSVRLDYAMQLFQVKADILGSINNREIIAKIDQLTVGNTAVVPFMTSTALPPKPEIFLGRDTIAEELVIELVSVINCRLPVLGTGGIGKTSLVLAVLADARVVAMFGENRNWVPCIEATSISLFIDLMATGLGVSTGLKDQFVDVMAFLRTSKDRRVIVFDNLETPWNLDQQSHEVERILCSIASISLVSIIITMRASMPPLRLKCTWNRTTAWTLPALTKEYARELFLELSPETTPDSSLDHLLLAIDYVPLAVTLMASLVLYGETPTELLQEMDVEVSIRLSLESGIMRRKPEALSLLQVLSMLPTGTRRDFLPSLAPGLQTHSALIPLLQTALVSINFASRTVQVLSPIRAYVLYYHTLDSIARKALHRAYFDLLQRHPSATGDTSWNDDRKILSAEESNLETILLDALETNTPNLSETLEACNLYSTFQCPSKYRIEVADAAVQHARLYASPKLPHCLRILGDLMYHRSQYDEANSAQTEARDGFLKIGDNLGAAHCLLSLGDLMRLRTQYEQAESVYAVARDAFVEIGDKQGVAQCLRSLGNLMRVQNQYDKAESFLTESRDAFIEIGSNLDAARCLRSLGNIMYARSQYDQAESTFTEARIAFVEMGDTLSVALCLRALGDIMRLRNRYDEAESTYTAARDMFVETGHKLGAARCLRSLGQMKYMQSHYGEAQSALTEARDAFSEMGDKLGAAQCLRCLGDVMRKRNQYDQADSALSEARDVFVAAGSNLGAARCLQSLSEIMRMRKQDDQAESAIAEAQAMFLKMGLQANVEACQRRCDETAMERAKDRTDRQK